MRNYIVEISRSTNGRQTNCEENFNVQPKRTIKHRAPTVKFVKIYIIFKKTEQTEHSLIYEDDEKLTLFQSTDFKKSWTKGNISASVLIICNDGHSYNASVR